ncbi:MAG: PilZ domain-containing protein, partial [Thermodesulfobacteriota bacterium]
FFLVIYKTEIKLLEIGADMIDKMIEHGDGPKRLKRYHVKVLGNAVLEKEGVEESFLSNTLNISLSGALIETGHLIPLGSLLHYNFHVPGVHKTFNLLAEVVRREGPDSEEGGGCHGHKKAHKNSGQQRAMLQRYGIRFLDLTENDRAEIASYLFH